MQVPLLLKRIIYPEHGDLSLLRMHEPELRAYVPDGERFGLAREIILQRIYEREPVIPRGVVVDAGANVGMFSIVAATRADRVIAIEPDPMNFKILQLNLHANGLTNVDARPQALWHRSGEVLFDPGTHSTGGGVSPAGELRVDAITIDDLVDELGTIDLLKMDVEGAEFEAVPCARRWRSIRSLVAELHLTYPREADVVLETLRAEGFQIALVPTAELYRRQEIHRVLQNWRKLEGHFMIKFGLLAYLLAPVSKPRRPPGSRDMPLLFAWRDNYDSR